MSCCGNAQLDLGFEEDIRNVMRQVKQQRQTLMFSATWPQIIQKLASEFLASPVKVAIGSQDLQACKRVKQIVEGAARIPPPPHSFRKQVAQPCACRVVLRTQ